jgi:hypothetical protein
VRRYTGLVTAKADMNIRSPKSSSFLIYLLPLLHLSACVAFSVTDSDLGWGYMLFVDLPLSVLLGGIVWRFGHPLFWFGIFGTAWWYFLSLIARRLIGEEKAARG